MSHLGDLHGHVFSLITLHSFLQSNLTSQVTIHHIKTMSNPTHYAQYNCMNYSLLHILRPQLAMLTLAISCCRSKVKQFFVDNRLVRQMQFSTQYYVMNRSYNNQCMKTVSNKISVAICYSDKDIQASSYETLNCP